MSALLELRERVPLAPLTTLGVGGPADFYVRAATPSMVAAAARFAASRALPVLVLGGGSNLVVSDDGFRGLVLHVDVRGRELRSEGGATLVRMGAGESWDALVAWATEQGLAGIECLAGIPGSVGATPVQNVGAYGQEVSDAVVAVETADLASGEIARLSNRDCGFGYRNSRFKQTGGRVILSVTYRLSADVRPAPGYPELQRQLAARGPGTPTLAEVRAAVLEIRRRKSMLVDPDSPDSRSVGSFFTNPIVPEALLARLGADAPGFATPAGFKVPAAWLIEQAGFARGHTRGRVGLSRHHALAIVNRGGATAAEVIGLARELRDGVRERFGITLQPEPTLVGIAL